MALKTFQVQPTFEVYVNEEDVERLCVANDVESFKDFLRAMVAEAIEAQINTVVDVDEANIGWMGLQEILIDETE